MVYISRFFVLLFACFLQTYYLLGQVAYVSSSIGDDSNNGLNENTPLKTISKALSISSDVRLKANDVFYVKGLVLKDKKISRYGEGDNPVLCGYKRIVHPKWVMVQNNIWRLNLAEDNFSGLVLKGSSLSNNIGCVHEYDKDLVHGHKVQYKSELKENWDIWQTERFDGKTPASEFDWVYLYYDSNPNNLKLEFSISDIAIRMVNSVVDGIDIIGYGFGISANTNTKVMNCTIDAIGGRIQLGYNKFTCYGNGVEFYVSKDISNCLVENCVISRCYDCGITIQASGMGQATPRNIRIKNNLIFNCCQGWEDFLRNDVNVKYENCVFENNVLLNNGNTSGFGYPKSRFKYCHVLGNNFIGDKGMIIRNNTFIGGNFYCSSEFKGTYKSNVWEGNTCYIERGDFILSNYVGSKDVVRIPKEKGKFRTINEASEEAIRYYRRLTGDKTTRFVIKNNSSIEKLIKKQKNKFKKSRK